MRPHLALLSMLFLALLSCSVPGQLMVQAPDSRDDVDQLSEAISLAIVTEKYWQLGESPEQIGWQASASRPLTCWVLYTSNGEGKVFVDELHWEISLVRDDARRWQPWDVWDQESNYACLKAGAVVRQAQVADKTAAGQWASPPKAEVDAEIQSPTHRGMRRIELHISPAIVGAVCNPTITLEERKRTEAMVLSVARDTEQVSWITKHSPMNTRYPGTLRIGRVTPGFPYVYYHVDNSPYLGKIVCDPDSFRVIHHDLLFMDERFERTMNGHYVVRRLEEIGTAHTYPYEQQAKKKARRK